MSSIRELTILEQVLYQQRKKNEKARRTHNGALPLSASIFLLYTFYSLHTADEICAQPVLFSAAGTLLNTRNTSSSRASRIPFKDQKYRRIRRCSLRSAAAQGGDFLCVLLHQLFVTSIYKNSIQYTSGGWCKRGKENIFAAYPLSNLPMNAGLYFDLPTSPNLLLLYPPLAVIAQEA
jgi:hypothetical protein